MQKKLAISKVFDVVLLFTIYLYKWIRKIHVKQHTRVRYKSKKTIWAF